MQGLGYIAGIEMFPGERFLYLLARCTGYQDCSCHFKLIVI